VGGVGGETAQDDAVLETRLQNLKDPMRPAAVAYQYWWFPVSSFFGLGIKNTLEPLQADLGSSVSGLESAIQECATWSNCFCEC